MMLDAIDILPLTTSEATMLKAMIVAAYELGKK